MNASAELPAILRDADSVILFGGTFDPIHNAHLLLAECAAEQLGADVVLFMPAYRPPHKMNGRAITPAAHRAAMVELAIAGNPRFVMSRHELDAGSISYTVDTLAWLRAALPAARLRLMLGADAVRDFPGWRRPHDIAAMAGIVAVARPGVVLPAEVLPGVPVIAVAAPLVEISSTDIRERVAAGRSVRYRCPDDVIHYFQQHGLYR